MTPSLVLHAVHAACTGPTIHLERIGNLSKQQRSDPAQSAGLYEYIGGRKGCLVGAGMRWRWAEEPAHACLRPQDVRAALLRLVTHLVVANSALVPLCLRVLAAGLQPPPAPPSAAQLVAGLGAAEQWEPSAEAVAVQDEVVAALEKVCALTAPSEVQCIMITPGEHGICCSQLWPPAAGCPVLCRSIRASERNTSGFTSCHTCCRHWSMLLEASSHSASS